MDASSGSQLIWGVVMLVVLASALISRRLPFQTWAKYALGWAAIFVGVYGLVLFRNELASVWNRARADLFGDTQNVASGGLTTVRKSGDGHFWVDGQTLRGTARFLIDSGATTSVISASTAQRLGIAFDPNGQPLVVDTANGLINVWPAEVDRLDVGGVRMEGVPVLVSQVPQSVDVLGMSWLSQLDHWQVRGDELQLQP